MMDHLKTKAESAQAHLSMGYGPGQLRIVHGAGGEIAKIYEVHSGREVSRYLKAPFEYRDTHDGAVLLTFAPNSNTVTSKTRAFAAE
ncbi:hypothetical protein [Aliiroseovarius sp.]|uniref:hypothetical protein n=1 Tax=Aliiroseovarius sp. TaxID=1872442 RepID=UPI003BAB4FD7